MKACVESFGDKIFDYINQKCLKILTLENLQLLNFLWLNKINLWNFSGLIEFLKSLRKLFAEAFRKDCFDIMSFEKALINSRRVRVKNKFWKRWKNISVLHFAIFVEVLYLFGLGSSRKATSKNLRYINKICCFSQVWWIPSQVFIVLLEHWSFVRDLLLVSPLFQNTSS